MARDGELDPGIAHDLPSLVEALVDEADADRRARLLVRHAQGRARAACLWAEAPGGGWRSLTSRGSGRSLPGADVVQAVAEGALEPAGPDGRVVLLAGEAPCRVALALVGAGDDETAIDELEVLLCLTHSLLAAEGDAADPLAPFGDGDGSSE